MTVDPPIRSLETELAALRPLHPDDAGCLFEIQSDPATMCYFGKVHEDSAETRALLTDLSLEEGGGKWHRLWAIVPAGETACRGWVGLMNRIPDQDNAEVGIILHADWRGRGLAKQATRAALAYGFADWGLHRVYANVVPANGPSVRLFEALGFRREGLQRETFQKDGAYHDDLLYALLAREFEAG